MRKMKSGFAIAAAILAVFTALLGVFSVITLFIPIPFYGGLSSLPMSVKLSLLVPNIISIVFSILLAVCCFRRKVDVLPGVAMGLFALNALYAVGSNAVSLFSGTTPIYIVLLYLVTALLNTALFALMAVSCFTKGKKKFGFAPIGFLVAAILGAVAIAANNLSISGMNGAILISTIFSAVFTVIGDLQYVFAALAINGAKEDTAAPQQQYQQYQQYQAPQYQAPQYQAPQYQAPQYQAPQYQQPQYQVPVYQPAQAPQPQENVPAQPQQ